MLLAALAACQLFCSQVSGDNTKPSYPGPVPGGYLLPNGWTVTPVGKQVELSDLPLNIIVDGDKAFVATSGFNRHALSVVDLQTAKVTDEATVRQSWYGLARDAAREIMRIYAGDLGERVKADKSPVTDADQAAEAIIVAGLRQLTPGLVVVAEEEMAAGHVPKLDGRPFWLVDPLDGTKEFIKRNGEFTVNVALIFDGQPVLGVVYAPVLGTHVPLYR